LGPSHRALLLGPCTNKKNNNNNEEMFLKIVFFETPIKNNENLFANQLIRPLERKYNIIFPSRTPPFKYF